MKKLFQRLPLWVQVILSSVAAFLVIALTYNPFWWDIIRGGRELLEQFWHGGLTEVRSNSYHIVVLAVGVLLLVGWSIFLRVTYRSLRFMGLFLLSLVLGVVAYTIWYYTSPTSWQVWYLIGAGLLSVALGFGLIFNKFRRRTTGTVRTDDVDTDE